MKTDGKESEPPIIAVFGSTIISVFGSMT